MAIKNRSIDNSEDIIDSRQVIERIDTLKDSLEADYRADHECTDCDGQGLIRQSIPGDPAHQVTCITCDGNGHTADPAGFDAWVATTAEAGPEPNDATEYRALVALQEEAEYNASDWTHGATLIRDSYFEEYARQLAEDIGAIDPKAGWPNTFIDWEAAAEALQQDYTQVEFDGVTYWIR